MSSEDTRKILEPYIRSYIDTLNNSSFEQMGAFYHPNAVLVETNKSALWRQKDIEESLRHGATEFGKTSMDVENESFRGTNEMPVYEADFIYHTEKVYSD